MTLVEFLRARLDEIERPADEAHRYEHDTVRFASALHALESIDAGMGRHLAQHPPARVLGDIVAKRRIVSLCAEALAFEGPHRYSPSCADLAEDILRAQALPFADHADYDPRWRQ